MKKLLFSKTILFLGLSLLFSFFLIRDDSIAYAADTKLKVASVDYYEENIVVFNGSNTLIYFANENDAAKGIWDVIPVDNDPTGYTSFDISWLSANVENIIMVKGDVDTTPARLVIKPKISKFELSINYSKFDKLGPSDTIAPLVNIMTTAGTGASPIDFNDLEWKKGENGSWQSSNSLTAALVEKFMLKGTNIYFRIKAVEDAYTVDGGGNIISPDGTDGRRFSSEYKLKIAKKAPSIVHGIDGSKFTADIKYGKEYKVTINYEDGSTASSDWIQITDKTVKNVDLSRIVNDHVAPVLDGEGNVIKFNGETVAFPEMKIEVRSYATSKAASSKITEILLDEQRVIEGSFDYGEVPADAVVTGDKNIYVNYYGDKYIMLTIPTASADLPYEYCVVKKDAEFDLKRAAWTSVTKNTGVKILASKAPDGGTLYVRQKEIKSKEATKTTAAVGYALASTYIAHSISYPSMPVITKANLQYVKSYPSPLTITVALNQKGKSPYETSVASIKLGVREIGFDDTNVTLSDGVYTMVIVLNEDDVKELPVSYNKALTITFGNKTVDKTAVKITIKNPTAAGLLKASADEGTAPATTKIKMDSTPGAGNSMVYVVQDTAVTKVNTEDVLPVSTGTPFVANTDIAVPKVGDYVIIYEINSSRNIVRFISIPITASDWKASGV